MPWPSLAPTADAPSQQARPSRASVDESLATARLNPLTAKTAEPDSPASVTLSPRLQAGTVITRPPQPVEVAQISNPRVDSRLLYPSQDPSATAPFVAAEPNYEAARSSADGQRGVSADTDPARLRDENFNRLLDTLAALTPNDGFDDTYGSSAYVTGLVKQTPRTKVTTNAAL